MTPIIQEEKQDTILTKDITEQHIVVATYGTAVYMLTDNELGQKRYNFRIINSDFTKGNTIAHFFNSKTIQEAVENAIKHKYKVAVFHQSDWKQALQWLIDNA